MRSLTNQYSDLLSYLEGQKKSDVDNKRIIETKNIRNIIEDCTTDNLKDKYKDLPSDNPFNIDIPYSKGFDVTRFESLMRMKLVEDHKKSQTYDRPYISVTELLGCLRKTFYIRMKYPCDVNKMYNFSYLYLINRVGDAIHKTIQEIYDFTDIEKSIVSEKYKIKGRIDGIKDNSLIEIKSVDDSKIKSSYIKEHYYQGLVYSYILNTEYNYSVDTITIIYVSRNLKKIIPYDIPYDKTIALKFINYSPKLLLAISSNKVLDPINSDNEQCKYCLYKESFCIKDKIDLIQRPFDITKKNQVPRKSVFLM